METNPTEAACERGRGEALPVVDTVVVDFPGIDGGDKALPVDLSEPFEIDDESCFGLSPGAFGYADCHDMSSALRVVRGKRGGPVAYGYAFEPEASFWVRLRICVSLILRGRFVVPGGE